MPLTLRNVNPIAATLPTQYHIPYNSPIIIMSSHSNLASQDNERLILRRVPMDGYHSPRLHRIQETMTSSSSDWWKPYAEITPNKADYKASISSSPVGS